MKVLVCGSRDWGDRRAISGRLMSLPAYSTIIHGGASRIVDGEERSADALAGAFAQSCCFDEVVVRPDYRRWPRRVAPLKRNVAMLEMAPDLVIAFQRNGSRGTQHTIDEARKRGIPVEVHTA